MGEFSKLFRESRICECESAQVLPKEYCHWASAQNSSERAEEANGSLPRFSRKSIAILRLLKTGEQHRRMGVFGKSIGEFSKLFRESRRGEWEFSEYCHSLPSSIAKKKEYWIMGEFSKLFQGFHGRVLPFCDFSKLESSIGEWEYSERVLALKEYCHGRVLKTLPREQKRRMGVFSGFGERVLPFCDFSKLESSIGEWEYSERVLALWASSQNSSERAD